MYHFQITLSDVDRGVYEELDLRIARHPSETLRYLITRTLAYCLSFEDGIAFSKGGLSSAEEAPLSVRDRDGRAESAGSTSVSRRPSACTRPARQQAASLSSLMPSCRCCYAEANARSIHRVEEIEVWRLDAARSWNSARREAVGKNEKLELVRSDGQLYVTHAGEALNGSLTQCSLLQSS